MATRGAIDGFEIFDSVSRGSLAYFVADLQKARSGTGYLKFKRTVSGSLQTTVQYSGAMTMSGSDAVQVGEEGQVRLRMYLRAIALPTADMALWSYDGGSTNGIVLKTDGTLTCLIGDAGSPTSQGSATSVAVAVVSGNDFDKWYRLDFSCLQANVGSGTVDTVAASLTVTAPDGTTSTVTHNRTLNLSTPINFNLFRFFTGMAATGTAEVDLDDFVLRAATNADVDLANTLPAETRVAAIFPNGQGSEAEWTGEWWRCTKVRVGFTTDNRQTATSAGLRTTFTHTDQPAANWNMSSIGGVMLTALMRAGGSTIENFRLGGVTYAAASSVSTGVPPEGHVYLADFTARTPSELDDLEFGAESVHVSLNDLYGIHMQVLYSGNAHSLAERSTGGYRHKWVTWTGDNSGHRQITGVGFRPHAVLFCSALQAAGAAAPLFKTIDMLGRYCFQSNGAVELESLASLDADGFSIGLDINGTGNRYAALCVRDDGDGDGGRIFGHGYFTKPSTTVDLAHTLGYSSTFQADLLFAAGDASDTFMRTASFAANNSARLDTNAALSTDGILSQDSNGFSIGASTELNDANDGRFWWGWRLTPELAGLVQVGKVPGQSADAVVPTTGMNPYMVGVRGSNTTMASKRFHEAEYIGGSNSSTWIGGAVTRTAAVIALDSAGGTFTVQGGAGAGVHLDDAPVVDCYWMAWHQEAHVPPVTEVTGMAVASIGLIWIEAYLPE